MVKPGIEGSWIWVSYETKGRETDLEFFAKATVTITKKKMTVALGNKSKTWLIKKIDATANPKEIDFDVKGEPILAIYKFKNNRLVIALGDNKDRPKSFVTNATSDSAILVLRPKKATGKGGQE
jgi:uncharacterized protein (TIGR03067 family)